jgi:hypothetical protein
MLYPPVDTEGGFFRFNRPHNKQEVETFRLQLSDYALNAYYTPMLPSHTLVATDVLMSHHDQNVQHLSAGAREVPPILRLGAFKRLDAIELVLENALQVGNRKWSQVWKAKLRHTEAPHMAPAPVVVKIFEESYFKYLPGFSDLCGDPNYAEWFPGAHLSGREAWAFDRMKALQGASSNYPIVRIAL